MTAWLAGAVAVLAAVVTFLAARWYYGREVGELDARVSRAEGEGEALKVERADRSAAEKAANAATEVRWQREAQEAARETSLAIAFGRFGRVIRVRSPRRGPGGSGNP